jgi:hypothetical protein
MTRQPIPTKLLHVKASQRQRRPAVSKPATSTSTGATRTLPELAHRRSLLIGAPSAR